MKLTFEFNFDHLGRWTLPEREMFNNDIVVGKPPTGSFPDEGA